MKETIYIIEIEIIEGKLKECLLKYLELTKRNSATFEFFVSEPEKMVKMKVAEQKKLK